MIDTERKEDLFLDTKLIKSENRLGKLRIIDELHPVLGGQPTHEADQPNDNNPFLDLACTMQFTIDKVNAVDKKADTKLAKAQNLKDVANVAIARDNLGLGTSATMNATSTLSDRIDQTATIKAVNDVNRAASTAQKTANTANDKANTAQTRADSAYSLAGKKWDIINNTGYAPGKDIDDFIAGEGGYIRPPVNGNIPRTGLDVITKSQYGSSDLLQIAFPQRTSLEFHMRTKSADGWSRWFEFYHTANTTTDKSGFLRASGSANAVITTDLATKSKAGITRLDSSLSDAEDRAATPKAVNDVNRAASTAQKTANNAHALAQTKQDKLTFVGDGPEVMKTGAFGFGDVGTEDKIIGIRDFFQLPLSNAIYTIAGEWNNGPRGKAGYTGIAQTIVRKYRAGREFVIIYWENGRIWWTSRNSGEWGNWEQYITTENTTTDKSGFLRASGSANALTESDVTNSLGNSKTLVASQALVNSLAQKIDDVPVDKIFAFDSAIPPKGYIARNGQAIDKNTMPKLYARYGAKMPDDRNRVHRMQGSLTGGVGSTQEDAVQVITGSVPNMYGTGGTESSGALTLTNITRGRGTTSGNDRFSTIDFDSSKSPGARTSTETRVKSRIVIFCNKIQ